MLISVEMGSSKRSLGFTTWNWGTKPMLFRWPMREKMQATDGEKSSNVMRTLVGPGTGLVLMIHSCFIRNFLIISLLQAVFFQPLNLYCNLSNLKNTVLCFSGGKHVYVWNQLGELIITWWSAGNLMSEGDLEYIRRSRPCCNLVQTKSHVPWSWDLSWSLFEGYMLWEEKMIQTTTEPTSS